MEEVKRMLFRVPVDLLSKIEMVAKNNNHSINHEIVLAIEQYLKESNGK